MRHFRLQSGKYFLEAIGECGSLVGYHGTRAAGFNRIGQPASVIRQRSKSIGLYNDAGVLSVRHAHNSIITGMAIQLHSDRLAHGPTGKNVSWVYWPRGLIVLAVQ